MNAGEKENENNTSSQTGLLFLFKSNQYFF